MDAEPFRPRPWRVFVAFLAAPFLALFLPFLAMALMPGSHLNVVSFGESVESALGDAIFLTLIGAYPITLVFGLPLYLLINGRVGYGPIPPIIVGYVIVLAGLTTLEAMDHPVDREGLAASAIAAIAGALGGLVFWLIAVWRDPRR